MSGQTGCDGDAREKRERSDDTESPARGVDQLAKMTALRAALRAVSAEDLRGRLADADHAELRHVLRVLQIRLDPRFAPPGGVALAMRARFRGAPDDDLLAAGAFLVDDALESFDEIDIDGASDDELRTTVDHVIAREPEPFAEILLRVLATRPDRLGDAARAVSDSRRLAEEAEEDGVPPVPTATPAADEPATPVASVGSERAQGFEGDRVLFTPLDELLIRTTVASAQDALGAPSRDEIRSIIDEFARLNSQRRSSFFHLGFLSAFDDRVQRPAGSVMNEERRVWFQFGRLMGLARRSWNGDLADEVKAHLADLEAVLRDEDMGHHLVGPVVLAFLELEPGTARRILAWIGYDFHDMVGLYGRIFERARRAFEQGDHGNARVLFEAMSVRLDDLKEIWPEDGLEIELTRRMAMCLRARGDFDGASRLLDDLDLTGRPDRAASISAERALITCHIEDLTRVSLPLVQSEGEALRVLFERGRAQFDEAEQLNERDGRACYCLGLLNWCEGAYGTAAERFSRAEVAFRDDEIMRVQLLEGRAAFNLALARLRTLEPVDEPSALAALDRSLGAGYRPTSAEWRAVLDVAGVHDSTLLGEFLSRAASYCQDVAVLVDAAAERAREGRLEAIGCAMQLVHKGGPTPLQKYDLLEAALVGAIKTNDARADDVLEALDDHLARAASVELDARWCDLLKEDEHVKGRIGGFESDITRFVLLERSGRFEDAVGLGERIFWRAKGTPSSGIDAEDLIEMLVHLGAPPEMTDRLRAAIEPDSVAEPGPRAISKPVSVVFVGGDERQAGSRQAVMARLEEAYGGAVEVTWRFPGWSADWKHSAEEAARRLEGADVLVLMPFVRTNLGSYLRRRAGELNRPWVPCTCRGPRGIERAIHRAVDVVVGLRSEATGGYGPSGRVG